MTQLNIFFNERSHTKLTNYAKSLKISKNDAVNKIIEESLGEEFLKQQENK